MAKLTQNVPNFKPSVSFIDKLSEKAKNITKTFNSKDCARSLWGLAVLAAEINDQTFKLPLLLIKALAEQLPNDSVSALSRSDSVWALRYLMTTYPHLEEILTPCVTLIVGFCPCEILKEI